MEAKKVEIEQYLKEREFASISDIDDIYFFMRKMVKALNLGEPELYGYAFDGDFEVLRFRKYIIKVEIRKKLKVEVKKS